MSKIKDFMSKPITWGAYFKLCGVSLGLYGAAMAGLYAKYKYDEYEYEKGLKQFNNDLYKLNVESNLNISDKNESE